MQNRIDLGNEYSITKITSVEEIDKMRHLWEKWQYHPNADIDFYQMILKVRKEVAEPYIVMLFEGINPISILVGRKEVSEIPFKAGYLNLFKIRVVAFNVIYGGCLGNFSEKNSELVVDGLKELIKKKEFEIVFFHLINVESALYKVLRNSSSYLFRDNLRISNVHWKMNVPNRYDEILAKLKRKHRYWLRRVSTQLEKDEANQIRIKCISKIDNIESTCKDIEAIAKNTYHRGLGVGFTNNEEYRERLQLLSDKGWLLLYILYIKGVPMAYWLTTIYKGIIHLNATGYNSQYQKYEIGTYVLTKLFEDICNKKKANVVDFGFGDALYKQRFGDNSWEESDYILFPKTIKGAGVNFLRMVIYKISDIVKRSLKRSNLINSIKKIWRNKLKGKA
jgi:hypothetical protein